MTDPNIPAKTAVLEELCRYLSVLVDMLEQERRPPFRFAPFFVPHLERARELIDRGYTFEDLKELSYALEGLFHRNFLDYEPEPDPASGRPVLDLEYRQVLTKVTELTLELRVIGRY